MHRIRAFLMPCKIRRHPTPCLRCNGAGKSSC
nr:MAG TPA: AAA domain protein [Caudoviricetes sp.]